MFKKMMPLIILIAMVGAAWVVTQNPPKVDRGPRTKVPAMTVETMPVTHQDYQVKIKRYGRVQARQRTTLVAEASGLITRLMPAIQAGASFEKGDLLIQLDDANYRAELAIAQATLTESLQDYSDEQAQAEQAKQAWLLSGQPGEPSDRVLRKPQLKTAQAKVDSARSSVKLAEIALKKSQIRAPFSGSVASLAVEQGQAISSGAEVAVLLAKRPPEIEVALHQRDLPYLGAIGQAKVEVFNEAQHITDKSQKPYLGQLERVRPELDAASQQLFATVSLSPINSDTANKEEAASWPMVGRLVTVSIEGKLLVDAIAIPNTAIYQSQYVFVVNKGRLQKKNITLGWQDDRYSVVTDGLSVGDQLVLTALGQVSSGTLVKVAMKESAQ